MIYISPLKTTSKYLHSLPEGNLIISQFMSSDVKTILEKVKFVYLKRYFGPVYQKTTDIFQYIKDSSLVQLQQGTAYLIYDNYFDGESQIDFPILECLHYNCEKYNINSKQIFYITSNLKDEIYYKEFVHQHRIKNPLTICAYQFFQLIINYWHHNEIISEVNVDQFFTQSIQETRRQFVDKLFFSLSQKNRPERIIGTFLLSTSDIAKHGLISHNVIPNAYKNYCKEKLDDSLHHQFDTWSKLLPLKADDANIEVSQGDNLNLHLHNKTIFHIVNETLTQSHNNTSMFYSEKTFKPIMAFQPFVIYGQQYCHRELEALGFKLFHDQFDYSFDNEEDWFKRYNKLLISITDTINNLKHLTPDQLIEWKFKNEQILKHNFVHVHNIKFAVDKINTSLYNFIKMNNINTR